MNRKRRRELNIEAIDFQSIEKSIEKSIEMKLFSFD